MYIETIKVNIDHLSTSHLYVDADQPLPNSCTLSQQNDGRTALLLFFEPLLSLHCTDAFRAGRGIFSAGCGVIVRQNRAQPDAL